MMPVAEAAAILSEQALFTSARVLEVLNPGMADLVLQEMEASKAAALIAAMDVAYGAALLSRLPEEQASAYLALMNKTFANELRALLKYPENSVGRLMSPKVIAFNEHITVGEALSQLNRQAFDSLKHLFLLNDEIKLQAQVDIRRLVLADREQLLSSLASPVSAFVYAMDHKDEVAEKLESYKIDVLPVVDVDFRLVGVIESQGLLDALREDMATDMQTMVGASRDERALSSSFFAVRKRLPWLQINLLTAFLAAAVVAIFEDTIARYSALAVLLPIAAGQSGNAGAQALAVTMRGLTLREISIRHWFKVLLKEFGAGFINGLGIAVTCAAGVYFWSQSAGLALVMALAMIISMTIAGISGALVPIILKRSGMDPAQSSSIVLTTVTDVTGFMSFLGIATLLSAML